MIRRASIAVATLGATAAALAFSSHADEKRLAYGKHLSQECTTCHRLDGGDKGIPSIIGLKPDYFVSTMRFYKNGERQNPVMNSVAQMLNEEQMEALAAFFESQKAQKPPAARKR